MNVILSRISIMLLHLKRCIFKLSFKSGPHMRRVEIFSNCVLLMSSTHTGSSEIQCFKCSNIIEIRDRIMHSASIISQIRLQP